MVDKIKCHSETSKTFLQTLAKASRGHAKRYFLDNVFIKALFVCNLFMTSVTQTINIIE
jgi:hypothetical protein